MVDRRAVVLATLLIVAFPAIVFSASDDRIASYAAALDQRDQGDQGIDALKALAKGDFILADYATYDLAVELARRELRDEALALFDTIPTRFRESPVLPSAQLWRIRLACFDPASKACGDRLKQIATSRLTTDGKAERLFHEAAWMRTRGRTVDAYRTYQKLYYHHPLSPFAEKARQETVILRRVVEKRNRFPWPTYEQRMGRVKRLMKAWEYKRAEQELLRMATLRYNDRKKATILYETGMARYRGREREGAKRSFEEYLERFPKGDEVWEARYRIGLVDWNRDRNGDAVASLAMVAKSSRSVALVRSSLLILGRIAEEEGRFQDALTYYRSALRKGGSETFRRDLRWRSAWLLYRMGADAEATLRLKEAQQKTPKRLRDGRFLFWQAKIADRGGRHEEAARLRDQLEQESPETYYGATVRFRREEEKSVTPTEGGGLERFMADYDPGERLSKVGMRHLERFEALLAVEMKPRARVELARLYKHFHNRATAEDALWTGVQYKRAGAPLKAMTLQASYFEGRKDKQDLTAPFWSLYYPREEWEKVGAEAERHTVDPFLILSIIRQESAFDPTARSSANARGLMQMIPSTGERVWGESGLTKERKERFHPDTLYDPAINIRLGVAYFAGLLKRYDGRVTHALAAYNAGEAAVDRWRERFGPLTDEEFAEMIPYRETRGYVKKILRNRAYYRALHRAAPPAVVREDP